ncbi:Unconventional myosin-IXb [Homalodisca vitripennis]|nr:Unconventional myosin-IXb [Homalodisca vitripennis]
MKFYLREKLSDNLWADGFTMDPQLIRDYFYRFLYQPQDREYPDLCQLPDLNEQTLLENLRTRFLSGHIYTYVGSILIAVNPFKFHPIYNPKYVKLYQHRRLGPELPPHIFAVADSAYHSMLRSKRNQCIVISGESGSVHKHTTTKKSPSYTNSKIWNVLPGKLKKTDKKHFGHSLKNWLQNQALTH